MRRILAIAYLLVLTLAASCLQDRQAIKFEQYRVQGRILYLQYCSSCHQSEGQGLVSLYPPVAASDYMLADKSRTICIIMNGQQGRIRVNGQEYDGIMPANENLTELEVAQITTYLYATWGKEKQLTSMDEVRLALEACDLTE